MTARIDLHHALRGRVRGHRKHVFGAHQASRALAQVVKQAVPFVGAIAVGLVQRQQ
ncbi:hypothetical protein RLIN73S_02349 [Rhodanobacter lindaniclasticus]